MTFKIFEVQEAALANGVYKCYEEVLLATGWEAGGGDKFGHIHTVKGGDAVEVEVLNLIENDLLAGYTNALILHDRLIGWASQDESGDSKWVGIPLSPSVRRMVTTEAAPADTQITCNMYDNDGVTAVGSGMGFNIEVYAKSTLSADLNEAVPRLASDIDLWAQNISGKWWCVTLYQMTEDCSCS